MNPHRSEPQSDQIERGLRCRKCGCGHFRVVYTRRAAGGRIVRRRECRHCGTRLTTWERIAGTPRDS
jgi:transcriptional regulator NrdR family protein